MTEPSFKLPGNLYSPCTYAWMRKGKPLYVGQTSRSVTRIGFHNIINEVEKVLPDDEIWVWFFPTQQEAIEYENKLLGEYMPFYNNRFRRYTEKDIAEMKRLANEEGWEPKRLVEKFGGTRGRIWAITKPLTFKRSKITREQGMAMLASRINERATLKTLASRYKLSEATVCNILKKLGEEKNVVVMRPMKQRCDNKLKYTLLPTDIQHIRKLAHEGVPKTDLAALYRISRTHVYNIINKKMWPYVPDLPDHRSNMVTEEKAA